MGSLLTLFPASCRGNFLTNHNQLPIKILVYEL